MACGTSKRFEASSASDTRPQKSEKDRTAVRIRTRRGAGKVTYALAWLLL